MNPKASRFMQEETQFHLGFLPTEQSNPLSKNLESAFKSDIDSGVRVLQNVDRAEVLPMARRIFASREFAKMCDDAEAVVRAGGRIVFSGCGATGRLSILLESMWRDCRTRRGGEQAKYADAVMSIMTGGDFALVKSVEYFEDSQEFGRRQVRDLGMTGDDMLVAITEGGETSSVLGTLAEAADLGCRAFLLFNNPAKLLAERLERSRRAIEDCRVTVLDLYCGPMALAGSTRMQATTSEQLVAGAMLEVLDARLEQRPDPTGFAEAFAEVLDELESDGVRRKIADFIAFEEAIYHARGKVTYFASDYLLDLFTDTTERSPTFMLPPFRRSDDTTSPAPWAFVKNPLSNTPDTWRNMLRRAPRCLAWTPGDYRAMNAEAIASRPPKIAEPDLYMLPVGNEPCPERHASREDAALLVTLSRGYDNDELIRAYEALSGQYAKTFRFELDSGAATPMRLMDHMKIKLAMNTVSTGTMVRLGRVSGNWMSFVDVTNKKLCDRAVRLIAELAGVDYATACSAVFDAVDALEKRLFAPGEERPSPVQFALAMLGRH